MMKRKTVKKIEERRRANKPALLRKRESLVARCHLSLLISRS